MGLATTAARGGAITIGFQALKVAIMLASTIVLARLLSPTDYGLVAMVVAVVGVGEIFRDFGLSMAALQARDLTARQQSNLFWINSGVGVVLCSIFLLLAPVIADFYGRPELVGVAQVLSITFLFGGLSAQLRVSINKEMRFLALAMTDVVPYGVALIVAVSMAALGCSYWSLVAQQLTASSLGLVLALLLSRWRPGRPGRAPMRHLLGFGLSFAGTQLVSYFTRNIDSIGIGKVWGASSLGVYDRAYTLVVMPLTQLNTPLSRVAIPVLSSIHDDRARFLEYLKQAQLIGLYVTGSLFGLLIVVGEQIVVIVLGANWADAGRLLSILAIGGVFRSLVQVSYWIYMATGAARSQAVFFLFTQPILAGVILAGLPWGPTGVALAHSGGFAVYWLVSVYWASRVAGLPRFELIRSAGTGLLLFTVPAILLAGLATRVVGGSEMLVVLVGVLSFVIWWVTAYALFGRVRKDLHSVIRYALLAFGRKVGG